MSVNQHRIPLVQAETVRPKASVIIPAIKAVAEVVLGLLNIMFVVEDRAMETWAKAERVTWYRGCRR